MTAKQQVNRKTKKDTARQLALDIICAVFNDGAYANLALNKALRTKNVDDRDRRFITELVYGTVKAKGTLDWLLSQLSSRPVGKIDKVIVNILRMGLYQIFIWIRFRRRRRATKARSLLRRAAILARQNLSTVFCVLLCAARTQAQSHFHRNRKNLL